MPTIKDIARMCGVSTATVSYVINNGPRPVHPQTRERVLSAIQQLNYFPSAVARGLQGKRMNAFGVVFPGEVAAPLSNPYFAPVLDGILDIAMRRKQNLTLFSGHTWTDAVHSLPVYCDGRCDGLLLIAPPAQSDIIAALLEQQVPFVLINESPEHVAISRIDVDNVAAASMIVHHLLQQGHRRIGMLCAEAGAHSVAQRLQGYRQAIETWGLFYDPALVVYGQYQEASGYENAQTLLRLPAAQRPTALFCCNDAIAFGAMCTLKETGLRVPEDISVAGFDDIPAAATADPPLTTVRQPLRRLGERAAEILLAHIHDGVPAGQKELLPTELVIRSSVAPPLP